MTDAIITKYEKETEAILNDAEYFVQPVCLDCEDTGKVHIGRHDNEEVKCHCQHD